jgi:anaerobic magnesium-protoporphyrin IX monomethyl ester cyclase
MYHVCFINPPSPFLVNDRGAPPLGILHLAAELDVRGVDVSLWDMTGDARIATAISSNDPEAMDVVGYTLSQVVEAHFEQDNPIDLFAITATSAQYDAAVRLKRMINFHFPKIPVAIGGSHVSTLPQMAVDDGFDMVVVGEADLDFPAHLEKYRVKRGRPFILSCTAPQDLDGLQIPARDLVDLRSYCAGLSVGEGLSTTVHASRGCPFTCTYCVRELGDKARIYRPRSAASVLAELDHLADAYGIKRFVFTDDIFGLKKPWLHDFCELTRDRGYIFRCNIRANTLYHDTLPALYRAGMRVISFGFESADESILQSISKNTVELNERAIKSCHDAGIEVKSYFIFGFEGDGEGSADALKRFIEKNRPDSAQIAWLIPLPGTPMYRQAILEGWLPDYQSLYHNGKNHRGGMSRLPWHADDTAAIYEDLVAWVEDFYQRKQPSIQCPVVER